MGVDGEEVGAGWVDTGNDEVGAVMQVTTRGLRPVERACSSRLDEMMAVVNSVSAAVPAPAHQICGAMKCSFSQFCRQKRIRTVS